LFAELQAQHGRVTMQRLSRTEEALKAEEGPESP
jgi:hypothetical protein